MTNVKSALNEIQDLYPSRKLTDADKVCSWGRGSLSKGSHYGEEEWGERLHGG